MPDETRQSSGGKSDKSIEKGGYQPATTPDSPPDTIVRPPAQPSPAPEPAPTPATESEG